MNFTATIRDTSTHQPELFGLFEEEPSGTRPDRIATLSAPQERVQRRTVQQIVDPVPLLPFLDDPAPQMVEQLPDVLQFFDALMPDPEQVIEVPKILPEDVPMRTTVRDTQLVPTIVSYGSADDRILFRCSYEWSRTLTFQFLVVAVEFPVFKGFLPGQSSTALHRSQERISERIVEQNVDSRVVGGGLKDFRPVQVPQRLLRFLLDTLVKVFF